MNEISQHMVKESPEKIANRLMEKAEFSDGLQEIAIGVLVLTFAGMTGLPLVFQGRFSSVVSFWGVMLFVLLQGIGSQWAIKKVRKRFLAGKMGYVKLKPAGRMRRGMRLGILIGISFVVAALFSFVAVKVVIATMKGEGMGQWGLFQPAGWGVVGTGILGGATMIFRVRVLRYLIGGVMMTALGILLAFIRVPLDVGLTILYSFAGLLALVSGCVVFFHVLLQPVETGE